MGFLNQLQVVGRRQKFERSCRWTVEKLRAEQARRTDELRRFAYARSPFYQRYHRGLENRPLETLPILTKRIMMESFDDLVTDRSLHLKDLEAFLRNDDGSGLFHGRYVALSTSGSTGQRGVFVFSKTEWTDNLASISRPMLWAGLRANPFRPGRSAMVASTTTWHYSSRVGRSLASRMLPTLRLDAGEAIESMVQQLNEWQPQVLVGYPSILRQLAEEQIAGRLRIAPKTCATSAEVLTAETRRRVKEAWGVRMFDTYGATEYAPIAAECEAGSKHLFEDGAVIEVTDERGRPVPPGELGDRVLLTIFGRHTQPLIRYEISDMLRVAKGECSCGRPFRFLTEIEGRQEEVLHFASTESHRPPVAVHPNVFHRLLETVPVSGWQVIQEDECLTVNLAGLRDANVCHEISIAMRELLQAEGASVPPLRVIAVSELRRGKTGKAPLVMAARA